MESTTLPFKKVEYEAQLESHIGIRWEPITDCYYLPPFNPEQQTVELFRCASISCTYHRDGLTDSPKLTDGPKLKFGHFSCLAVLSPLEMYSIQWEWFVWSVTSARSVWCKNMQSAKYAKCKRCKVQNTQSAKICKVQKYSRCKNMQIFGSNRGLK